MGAAMKPAIEIPGYKRVYAVICRYGDSGASKVDIANTTGMPRHQIHAKVSELIRQGYVKELAERTSDKGRIDRGEASAALYAKKGVQA